jgi:hypothetical protein
MAGFGPEGLRAAERATGMRQKKGIAYPNGSGRCLFLASLKADFIVFISSFSDGEYEPATSCAYAFASFSSAS